LRDRAWAFGTVLALTAMVIGSLTMTAKSDDAVAQATLDVFSGRPNPTWTLTAAETKELQGRLARLATKLPAAPDVPDLGYRGVQLTLGAMELSVARGGVSIQQGGTVTHLADAGRQLERWLVQTAQGKVSPDILKIAGGDLSASP
jgi:hypothetical protein